MKDKGIILAKGSFSYNLFYFLAIFIIYFFKPSPLYSQITNTESNSYGNVGDTNEFSQDLVSVFLDCNNCDNSYIRQQINFVNYLRDVQLAQVHIFIAKQATVKKDFDGINNNLTYTSIKTNTEDEIRKGLSEKILLGLVPYISHTAHAEQINITIPGQSKEQKNVPDPWNSWIFEVYGV